MNRKRYPFVFHYMIILMLLSVFIQSGCTTSGQSTSTSNQTISHSTKTQHNDRPAITDDPAVDLQTGWFQSDEYTILLFHSEDRSSLIADESLNLNDGIAHGIDLIQDPFFNYVLQLDGKGYVEINDSDTLDLTGPFSVELWFKPASTQSADYPSLISKSTKDSGTGWPTFNIYFHKNRRKMNGTLQAAAVSIEGEILEVPSNIALGDITHRWNYAALTWDTRELCLYHNGERIGCSSATVELAQAKTPLYIGRTHIERRTFFQGLIDEVRISTVKRSEKAIRATWNTVRTLPDFPTQ